jgi:FkbM family methyltransferase
MSSKSQSPLSGLRLGWYRLCGFKTTTLDGMVVVCDPNVVPRNVSTAIIKGSYELPERELVRSAIRKHDRVVEVGAGVGVVGILCSQLAGAGNVLSYEANAALQSIIAANYALNGITPRLLMRAMSIDGEPLVFYRNDNVVSSSVYDRGLTAQMETVESDALAAVLLSERADVLVMDIEGAEIDLLTHTDLTCLREIIVELHPHIVGEEVTEAMLASIRSQGFREVGRIHKNIHLSRQA